MEKTDLVFIVLVYRNFEDIYDLVNSIKKNFQFSSFKILIVNSYYDDITLNQCKNISESLGCIFMNVENRGYSYGNNCGIEYVKNNYDYNFLIVANPDIVFQDNSYEFSDTNNDAYVLAPQISTLTNKQQNPYWVKPCPFSEYCEYLGYKTRKVFIAYIGFIITKIVRICFVKQYEKKRAGKNVKIYAAHGSCIFFSRKAIEKLNHVFDDGMFLFAEENLLAHRLSDLNIDIFFSDKIKVLHKEDGSMNIAKIDESSEIRKSFIYYYEKIRGGNSK